MPPKQSTDLGAALRGLLLGGSVLFLLLLTIVWLTNRHFEGKKEAVSPAAQQASPQISPTAPGAESATVAPGPAAPPPASAPPANAAGSGAPAPSAAGKAAPTAPPPPPPAP